MRASDKRMADRQQPLSLLFVGILLASINGLYLWTRDEPQHVLKMLGATTMFLLGVICLLCGVGILLFRFDARDQLVSTKETRKDPPAPPSADKLPAEDTVATPKNIDYDPDL